MIRYIIRRLLLMIPVAFLVTIGVFTLARILHLTIGLVTRGRFSASGRAYLSRTDSRVGP